MATRVRQSTVASTPRQARGAPTPTPRQSTVGPAQRQSGTQLPPYEPPTFSLNPAAQRALAQLAQAHNLRNLDSSLSEAQDYLSVAAAEINDRLLEKEKATKKRKAQAEQLGSEDVGNTGDLEQSVNELRDKVERMTQRMDESMRKMIDGQHSVQSIKESVAATANDARANASTQASTQNVPTQRRRRRETEGGEDDDDNDDDDDEYQDFTPTDPRGGTQAQPTPIHTFQSKIEDAKTRYQSHSLTARYADNNHYRDFRRVVHDAKHPDGDVPLAHHTEWFEEAQAPANGVTTRANANGEDEDSDDDLEVSKAKISTKCPLTLTEFKEPLTSKKCPHSFEAEAIMSMIRGSAHREGGGGRHGEQVVQCPVSGCSQMLRKNDLQSDAVLIRQIKRLQRSKQLDAEDADEDEEGGAGGGDGPTVIEDGDDDAADVDDIVEGRAVLATQMKSLHPAAPIRVPRRGRRISINRSFLFIHNFNSKPSFPTRLISTSSTISRRSRNHPRPLPPINFASSIAPPRQPSRRTLDRSPHIPLPPLRNHEENNTRYAEDSNDHDYDDDGYHAALAEIEGAGVGAGGATFCVDCVAGDAGGGGGVAGFDAGCLDH
ncbi:hypothetical protein LTR37_018431 [Vermiconidia calcicola]|uniref:Uncharacterized protein n=1 Tax=Vermiconidia calcicola TaxID=1690605 RepID=A0ACC3MJW4_9PEZI|nr:hypothetical protein LTR37_018431 [Vermiconidia calcicola]